MSTKLKQIIHDLSNVASAMGFGIFMNSKKCQKCPNFNICDEGKRMLEMSVEMKRMSSMLTKAMEIAVHEEAQNRFTPIDMFNVIPTFNDGVVTLSKLHDMEIKVESNISENCFIFSTLQSGMIVTENAIVNAHNANATKMTISIVENDDYVDVFYRDNGFGIKRDKLEKMELEWVGKSGLNGHGTGIIIETVQQGGGTVKWNSIEGFGTEMRVRLKKATKGERLSCAIMDAAS